MALAIEDGRARRRETAECRSRARRALPVLVLAAALGAGIAAPACRAPRVEARAIGVPALASRTPDLDLPLAAGDRDLALYYLDGKRPPRASWERFRRAAEEEMQAVDAAAMEARFGALLDALAAGDAPVEADLAPSGRIGRLFEPGGATEEALDARLRGQIVSGDILAGLLGDHWFLFYRRHPIEGEPDATCEPRGSEPVYCRLVIVAVAATRRH